MVLNVHRNHDTIPLEVNTLPFTSQFFPSVRYIVTACQQSFPPPPSPSPLLVCLGLGVECERRQENGATPLRQGSDPLSSHAPNWSMPPPTPTPPPLITPSPPSPFNYPPLPSPLQSPTPFPWLELVPVLPPPPPLFLSPPCSHAAPARACACQVPLLRFRPALRMGSPGKARAAARAEERDGDYAGSLSS